MDAVNLSKIQVRNILPCKEINSRNFKSNNEVPSRNTMRKITTKTNKVSSIGKDTRYGQSIYDRSVQQSF